MKTGLYKNPDGMVVEYQPTDDPGALIVIDDDGPRAVEADVLEEEGWELIRAGGTYAELFVSAEPPSPLPDRTELALRLLLARYGNAAPRVGECFNPHTSVAEVFELADAFLDCASARPSGGES